MFGDWRSNRTITHEARLNLFQALISGLAHFETAQPVEGGCNLVASRSRQVSGMAIRTTAGVEDVESFSIEAFFQGV